MLILTPSTFIDLVMQDYAGMKFVGQAAITALDHFNQIIRLQLHSPAKFPHDDKAITYLDSLITQDRSNEYDK